MKKPTVPALTAVLILVIALLLLVNVIVEMVAPRRASTVCVKVPGHATACATEDR